ncbi:hypothetical protein LWI28_010275 [Acer negundo]|uniref:BHLH domain-containing protein n=1 Tax=Acer negundo TaxID=4023 RepID=A0AAD5NTK4_ACENE|nr:hypothetical protein LWI28_010275 [Acer negundo]
MPAKDIISWTTMITCYSQNKRFREALYVFNDMKTNGFSPDEVTISSVILACAYLGALDLGKEIHLYLMQNGFNLDVYIGSALIDMNAKCGSLDRPLSVFFKLWNSIIEGLAVHGFANKALAMFDRMENEKINPNGVTFISILSACTHAGLVKESLRRFQSMSRKYFISPELEHYGCMVDLLSKAGLLGDALELIRSMNFNQMQLYGVPSWGDCLNSSGVCSAVSSKGFSSTCPSTCSEHLDRSSEPAKNNKKRAKPGENCRPRPRDRQLIQDRIKELRELVPSGSKSLLARTIKHMLFLQSITKHADKLSKCTESKMHQKGTSIQGCSSYEQDSSWAVEVGSHLKMCEECSHFLEIAEVIRSLGLTILKGVTEAHGEKTWICFVVEGQDNRIMHRMDVLWSLVQILQSKTACS